MMPSFCVNARLPDTPSLVICVASRPEPYTASLKSSIRLIGTRSQFSASFEDAMIRFAGLVHATTEFAEKVPSPLGVCDDCRLEHQGLRGDLLFTRRV